MVRFIPWSGSNYSLMYGSVALYLCFICKRSGNNWFSDNPFKSQAPSDELQNSSGGKKLVSNFFPLLVWVIM